MGLHPFLEIPQGISRDFFANALFYLYISLPWILSMLFLVLYLYKKNCLLGKHCSPSCAHLQLHFPFFAMFPCQDPNNFFITNLRQHTFTPKLTAQIKEFQTIPSLHKHSMLIANSEMGAGVEQAVPVSCFPSMHATWGLLVVYYVYRIRPYTLMASLPWLIFMLFGGVALLQHYVIDYLAAFPCALLSIRVSQMLMRKYGSWGNSAPLPTK